MTRRLFALCLLCFSAPLAAEHPLSLWEVSGTNNAVYLLGSVHLLRDKDHPLPSRIEDAYTDAESIVMEIDMDDIDPVAMQSLINELGVLSGGQTLADLMGAERYARAAAAAETMDIPFEMLSRSEPWLAAITIEQMALARLGFNPLLGIEMTFTAKAASDGKAIEGFETIEEQLSFLDGLSLDAQNDLLLSTLEQGREIEAIMDDLIDAWRIGDVAFFEKTILSEMQAYPELYHVIVADRNARWVKQINELLDDEDDYLVIVGALHLVGPDGVPALLESQGTRIKQLNQTE